MFGDTCTTCNCEQSSCTCSPSPCLPGDADGECGEGIKANCVFWMGDDIPGTPIKHGTRLTAIVLYLLDEINTLKAQLP